MRGGRLIHKLLKIENLLAPTGTQGHFTSQPRIIETQDVDIGVSVLLQ
jgi:hypothetical protein